MNLESLEGATPGVPRGSAVQAETSCPWILTDLWSQRWVLEPPTSPGSGTNFLFLFSLFWSCPCRYFQIPSTWLLRRLRPSPGQALGPAPPPPPPAPESVPVLFLGGSWRGEFRHTEPAFKTPKKQKGPTAGVSNTKLTSFYPDEGANPCSPFGYNKGLFIVFTV